MNNTKKMVESALIAGIYAALTLFLAPLSFGPVQYRFAEALTLLAVFNPTAIFALGFGCFLSNLVGLFLGQTMVIDIILGPIATMLAAWASWRLRKLRLFSLPVASALMPALFNGLIIGPMLAFLLADPAAASFLPTLFSFMGSVAFGEVVICLGLGLPLVKALEKTGLSHRLFGGEIAS